MPAFSTDRNIALLTGATSSAAPSVTSATAGVAMPFSCDQCSILVHSTAGSGTMTATLRIWGFNPEVGRWYDLGALNSGSAIAEVSTADTIAYAESLVGLRAFNRLHCEITSLGGTATAVTVTAVCSRAETVTSA